MRNILSFLAIPSVNNLCTCILWPLLEMLSIGCLQNHIRGNCLSSHFTQHDILLFCAANFMIMNSQHVQHWIPKHGAWCVIVAREGRSSLQTRARALTPCSLSLFATYPKLNLDQICLPYSNRRLSIPCGLILMQEIFKKNSQCNIFKNTIWIVMGDFEQEAEEPFGGSLY